jgi:hypothetical protein
MMLLLSVENGRGIFYAHRSREQETSRTAGRAAAFIAAVFPFYQNGGRIARRSPRQVISARE